MDKLDKENVVYLYNGILFSHKKGWNLAIWDNVDGPLGHYTMWSQRKTNSVWFHLYLELKNKLVEREQIGSCRRGWGKCTKEVKRYKLLVISSGHIMYSMVTVLYIHKRMNLKYSYYKKKEFITVRWWILTKLVVIILQ